MTYYFVELAWLSLKRSPVIAVLSIVILAFGVSGFVVTLAILQGLSADPLPGKSGQLFNVQLDAGPRDAGFVPGSPPMLQLTRYDAEALLKDARAARQVMMTGGGAPVVPDGDMAPFIARGRWTTADFFKMFEAPFLFGSGWSAAEDGARAPVAVISAKLNDQLFGGADSRGKLLNVRGKSLRIIGVLAPWRPVPHFFDLTTGAYQEAADLFVPFATAIDYEFATAGKFSCWAPVAPRESRGLAAPCTWIQYWVQLDDAAAAGQYKAYLTKYSDEQRNTGRFERPTNVALTSAVDWLRVQKVIPDDVRRQFWLAAGFLVVCIANATGLQLAKTLRHRFQIGVRRALGATRQQVVGQVLAESALLGVIGGALGLALAFGGTQLMRQGANDYSSLTSVDPSMLAFGIAVALVSAVFAGAIPAWVASKTDPAALVKGQ